MLVFGIPFVAYITQLVIILESIPGIEVVSSAVQLLTVGSVVVHCSWMYAVGMGLTRKVPDNRLNETWFKVAIGYQLGYSILQNIVFPIMNYQSTATNLVIVLISLVFAIYSSHFLSTLLRAAEESPNDGSGDFFLFLFDVVGIWWLQPRINRIFDDDVVSYDPDMPLDQHVKDTL